MFGLAIGAGLFPANVAVGLPIWHQDVLFSFAVVLAIRCIDDINHLLGQNVLRNFITGYYHRPRLEQRVFPFIDIEGSTALATGEIVDTRGVIQIPQTLRLAQPSVILDRLGSAAAIEAISGIGTSRTESLTNQPSVMW